MGTFGHLHGWVLRGCRPLGEYGTSVLLLWSRLEWRRDGWRKDFEKLGQVIELVEAQNESLDHLLPCLVGPVGLDGSDGAAVIGVDFCPGGW